MKRAAPYIALIIFVGCAYLGRICAVRIVYRHEQSSWFNSVGKQDAAQLRATGQALVAFQLSSLLIQNTLPSLQSNLSSLAKIRPQTPQELCPILDLRRAKDYAMMARLEQKTGNLGAAADHQQSARALLLSLGWQDVSDSALTELADGQFRSRLKR